MIAAPRSVRIWSRIENLGIIPAAALVAGLISFWALEIDREPPLALEGGMVSPQTVKVGDSISASWNIKRVRSTAYRATCTRDIIDSQGVFWRVGQNEFSDAMPQDVTTISGAAPVPFAAAWGRAHYRLTCCYKFKGLTLTTMVPVCVQRPDLPFDIAPRERE